MTKRAKMPPANGVQCLDAARADDGCPPEVDRVFRGVQSLFVRVLRAGKHGWEHRSLGKLAPNIEYD